MTLEELKKQPLWRTRRITAACEDRETLEYIITCLQRFFSGDYGEICAEDTAYNNEDLKRGYGHVLARYKAHYALESDIYIDAHFSKYTPGAEANNTAVMYCEEH